MKEQIEQAQLANSARLKAQPNELVIDGKTTRYWFYPAANQSKAQNIIFIHGYRGNHHGLEAIAGAIKGINVYIPDLPGFGESEAFDGEHSIENYAAWVHNFILGLGLAGKPHLLGHSFGSIVVSAFASRYDDIETLILENPVASPALSGPKAGLTLIAKAFFALARTLSEKTGTWLLKSWPMVRGMSIVMTKSRANELRRWVHKQHDENFNDFANRRVALEGYSASISNCVSDYVAQFKVPVLMLIGEKDDITSVAQQQRLFAAIPTRKEFKLIEKVGHLTHYEVPNRVAAEIRQWVQK